MTTTNIIKKLNLENLPEDFDRYIEKIPEYKENLCSEKLIDDLQEKFDFFGKYFSTVKQAFSELKTDDTLSLYLDAASIYYKENDIASVRLFPIPATDGSLAKDFLSLFIMLPSICDTYDEYRKRGFSHESTLKNLDNFKLNIWVMEEFILGRPAISGVYYRWLSIYAKCLIFNHGGLNFELKTAPKSALFIKNKNTGEVKILINLKGVHRSGMPLGCAGYEDEDGAFSAGFEETETEIIGNPVENYRIQKEKKHFSKSVWEICISPGDDVIGIHIPRNTDLSPDKISLSYKEALEMIKNAYPEFKPKALTCASWLMDPELNRILGEKSKISSFSAPFVRHPNRNNGRDIFGYVFPSDAKDFSLLPENTSLQRKLKEKYLKGEFIYSYTGAIIL